MAYLKGTEQKCKAYNALVAQVENYTGLTTYWAPIVHIGGEYYIRKHPDYPATNGLVGAELPEPEGMDGI